MFSRIQLLAATETVASRFNAHLESPVTFLPKVEISGFEHSPHPIILSDNGRLICDVFQWGLIPPDWGKAPEDIWNYTISAKLEYLVKRYAWQKVAENRCLVPATAYFEYHWNDPGGKSKTKYIIKNSEEELFALAGLFSLWRNSNGDIVRTFAICTTSANEIMQFVHNKDAAKNYHRMPIMLNRSDETDWLDRSISYMDFAFPKYKPELIAIPVENGHPIQGKLF